MGSRVTKRNGSCKLVRLVRVHEDDNLQAKTEEAAPPSEAGTEPGVATANRQSALQRTVSPSSLRSPAVGNPAGSGGGRNFASGGVRKTLSTSSATAQSGRFLCPIALGESRDIVGS